MPGRDIVVIGGSAGAIDALVAILRALPREVDAALFIVLHRRHASIDTLLTLLRTASRLPLHQAVDGERIHRGRVHVCPPDRHLIVERGRVRVQESPVESMFRPNVDALFRSAALAYGRRVVGVVLSGALADGTAGLWQIKKRGGVAIVQDPAEAVQPGMPQSALASVDVDHCLPAADIAARIADLAAEEPPPPAGPGRARVLVVEDQRLVARNIERRLAEMGYVVSGSAATGAEAITLAERTRPDVVLMDIDLPGAIDGAEAARRIWERLQIPVVYLTAYADEDTLEEVMTTESYGFVVKPFRPAQVHAALQLALERRNRETAD